jgi:DNA topoisomerase VI subunit B
MKRASAKKKVPSLVRKTFAVSRLSEFVSESELVKQTGHAVVQWLEVVVKEVVDNALDEAEEAGLPPQIEVSVDTDKCEIVVIDRGRGIKADTVRAITDLSQKVSSRAAYVSPTRGQQGNALQTIFAMPCALNNANPGFVVIESRGVAHRIAFEVDLLRGVPVAHYERESSVVRNGTRIATRWPKRASSLMNGGEAGFLQAVRAFVCFNPHLGLTATWDGVERYEATPSEPDWKRWRPSDPTSPHWYDVQRLGRLIAAEIVFAEDKRRRCPTVREFVTQFHGLSSTAKGKAVLDEIGAQGMSLRDLHVDDRLVAALLAAMQRNSKPVNERRLGVIGRDHLAAWAEAHGGDPASFEYRSGFFTHDGLPCAIEVGFAYAPKRSSRLSVAGLNFSPVIGGRPFNQLEGFLGEGRVGPDDPVIVFMHLACPRLDFTDKGKSRLELSPVVGTRMMELIGSVTKKWTRQKEAETRDRVAFLRRRQALARNASARRMTLVEAAFAVMEEAYSKASANHTLPANARQIFYVARPLVQALVPGETLRSQYFTQDVLPRYMREREPDWEPAYDARGHFSEPHTDISHGLGTLDVDGYIEALRPPQTRRASLSEAMVSTHGPQGRYGSVLFIEKEGFLPIIEAAEISERFDVLITSSKGMSVTAARRLVDELCGRGCVRSEERDQEHCRPHRDGRDERGKQRSFVPFVGQGCVPPALVCSDVGHGALLLMVR